VASKNWVLSDADTLAEYVPLEDFKGILQQRIGVSPDHAALLIRDGRLAEAFTGAHFSVGGIWQSLKNALGGEHAVRLLVADLKPFQVNGEIETLSADNVPLTAAATVELQLNPERPGNILGLMHERGALTRMDVYQRLIPHLRDRVFDTVLRQVQASEVRGNTAMQDRIQADMMREAERLFGDVGLLVRSASVTWALNDEERAAMARREREREQQMLDHDFERKKRELEREKEASEFVLRSDLAQEKLKAIGENELKRLFLDQELELIDARDGAVREQELKKLNHEIELLNVERQSAYKKAVEDARNEVERAQYAKQLAQVELEIEEMQRLQALKLTRLEEEQNLDIAERARRQQLETMRGLNDVELDGEERKTRIQREDRLADHEMEVQRKRQEHETEIEKLKTQAGMTPEQLLAINAGLSPDVARIFSERARAEAVDSQKQEALLREMVDMAKQNDIRSDEQARAFFDKAMDGVAAVSSGDGRQGGGEQGGGETAGGETAAQTAHCAACHRDVPISDRFCRFCGQQMRT